MQVAVVLVRVATLAELPEQVEQAAAVQVI
jgi:hypothetical protein